ncbi:unnamed protein product [Linum trigynum]|uniref:Uncharacterized protein n=1 Tax=Linum trigynum TaxID=586398 RepID=A0AAV2GAP2_9ROSI
MAAFTGHSTEPCYTPQSDPNYELRLLVEQYARKMDLLFSSVAPPNSSSLRESDETVSHSSKQPERVEQVCAQLAQDHPSATILEEEEEEEGYKDIVEKTEIITESSREDHDQECHVVADHPFPHPTPSFEEAGMSEEMQEDLMKEIAWQLALQSVLEEEEQERAQKEVVEDDESEAGGVLDHFPGVIPHVEEREVEEAIGVQAEDEVEVEEACTGYELLVISPPNFEELLGKDPLQCLFARPRPHRHRFLLVDAMVVNRCCHIWFGEMRREKRRRGLEGGDVICIKCTSFHHLSYHLLVT